GGGLGPGLPAELVHQLAGVRVADGVAGQAVHAGRQASADGGQGGGGRRRVAGGNRTARSDARGGQQGRHERRLVGVGAQLRPSESVDEEHAAALCGREFRDGGGGSGYVHAGGVGGQQVGERSAAVLGHGRGVRGEGLGVGPP